MRALNASLAALTLGPLVLGACSGSETNNNSANNTADAGPSADTGVAPQGPSFTIDVVEGLGSSAVVGDFAQAANSPSGGYVVAYGFTPAGGGEREIHFASHDGDGAWSPELVTRPGEAIPGGDDLKGLGLAYVGGEPHVVFLGGDDDGRATIEEPTDLVMATKSGGQWTLRTLVDVSTEATGDCSEYCNEGYVVGSYAAIAANPSGAGFAVVYRDTHLGFAVDDLNQADVEVYVEGGPVPTNTMVDPERGGGTHGTIAYTPQGGLMAAYTVEFSPGTEDIAGVWAAVYAQGAWRLRRVHNRVTSAKIGAATTPDGTLYLAFFDTAEADLMVATSTDEGESWQTERVDSRGKTGIHPSLAIDAEGRPIISYGYCGPASDRGCPSTLSAESEVRLARLEAGGWALYPVDDGQGFGRVGFSTSITVDDSGKIGIAYVDDGNGDLLFAREQ